MPKRKREEDVADPEPSKQQKKERPSVDLELVDIYDRLADEKESKRVKAASRLLRKLRADSSDHDQINLALRRLFRGLCSTRKAARQGFAIALTELLLQLASRTVDAPLPSEDLISTWEDSTAPEGGASKQEERDHFLGRVFGGDAILKSGFLSSRNDRDQWQRFMSLLCTVAQKKPWLRQECGWLLFQFVATSTASSAQQITEDIITALSSYKLIRTPEGVAIWLAAKKSFPNSKMSKHVWKHGHPLASKDVKTLADIMKDARFKSSEDESEAQGSAIWSANLHFAWRVVIEHLVGLETCAHKGNGAGATRPREDIVSFQEFWRIVVDEGLFEPNSSPERKQSGLLVFTMALQQCPPALLAQSFSRNAIHCLVTAKSGKDGYLRKVCENAMRTFDDRIKKSLNEGVDGSLNASCVQAIITSTDESNLEQVARSKLVSTLITSGSAPACIRTAQTLESLLNAATGNTRRQKLIVELESKLLNYWIRQGDLSDNAYQAVLDLLLGWYDGIYSSSSHVEPAFRDYVQERLESCLEQCLRAGAGGRSVLESCVKKGIIERIGKGNIKCDYSIQKSIKKAWHRVEELDRSSDNDHKGLIVLYCLLIMDVAGGEGNAVEGLRELTDLDVASKSPDSMNALVELLLGLAARPSKFLRSASHQIFETITPWITLQGLGSLMQVLLTKENAQGQREMLEAADDEGLDLEDLDQSESDKVGLDSDVEVVDAFTPESSQASGTDSDSDAEAPSDSQEGSVEPNADGGRDDDDELAAFDAALASALGTSKLENGDDRSDSSDSDSDMDDDQMIALDEKLTEVFKARKEASSKKTDRKETKGAFIAFKNRVLDLMEIYLKQQCRSGLTVALIMPLLQSVRITQTKQIADRTCSILRQFFGKCKGQDVPQIGKDKAEETLAILRNVHDEACLETSNAHSALSSSASIVLVKVLLHAKADIAQLVDVYGDTRKRQLTDKSCRVLPAFFTDWNNWCMSAKAQLGK